MTLKYNNTLIYEGSSRFGHFHNIIAIVNGVKEPSRNRKTGPIPQVYFLLKHINPMEAIKSKEDTAICGACPLKDGICYVLPFQAPNAIWKSYQKRHYNPADTLNLKHSIVRIGAYGDPASVPLKVITDLESKAYKVLNYTHTPKTNLKGRAMLSVESLSKARYYQGVGWKTFRVRQKGDTETHAGEVVCPASVPNSTTQCSNCGLCDGATVNVVTAVHGSPYKQRRFDEHLIKEKL